MSSQESSLARREETPPGAMVQRAQMDAGPFMPSGSEHYSMPVIRLAQGQSKVIQDKVITGLEAGQFYSVQTQKVWRGFPGIVLRIQDTRTLFPEEGLGGPRCASDDNVTPRADMEFQGPCAKCPMRSDNPWSLKPLERRKRCLLGYTLLVLDAETGEPYIYRVHGTGIGPLRDLNTAYRMRYQFRPFAVRTDFKVESKANDLGTFYVARPGIGEELAPADVKKYEALALSFIGVKLTAADEQEDTTPEAATSGRESVSMKVQLYQDPEMRYTPKGIAVTNLKGYKVVRLVDGEPEIEQETVALVAWEELAELWSQHTEMGDTVVAEGYWRNYPYEGQDRWMVVLQNKPTILHKIPAEPEPVVPPATQSPPVQGGLLPEEDLPF